MRLIAQQRENRLTADIDRGIYKTLMIAACLSDCFLG
jgi:hypothetical protein